VLLSMPQSYGNICRKETPKVFGLLAVATARTDLEGDQDQQVLGVGWGIVNAVGEGDALGERANGTRQ
jgi:hypothetical protein